MGVRASLDPFIWRVEIDWPDHLSSKPHTRVCDLSSKLKKESAKMVDWLNANIGRHGWTADFHKTQGDHRLISNRYDQIFAIRVKTEDDAALIKLRWA